MSRMVKLYEVQLATGGVKFVLGWRCPVIDWRGIEINQLPVTWYSYGAHLFPPISMWIKQFFFKASCFYSGDLGLLSEIVERSKWTCVLYIVLLALVWVFFVFFCWFFLLRSCFCFCFFVVVCVCVCLKA